MDIFFLGRDLRRKVYPLPANILLDMLLLLLSLQSCPTLETPETAAHRAPPSLGFSRQEYWSGVPLPSPLLDIDTCKYLSLLSVFKRLVVDLLGAVLDLRCFILVAVNKGWLFSCCSVWASHCSGFFCCRARALGPAGSVLRLPGSGAQAQCWRLPGSGAQAQCCGSQALEHRLRSCGSQALEHRLRSCGTQPLLLLGMWDPSG